MKDFVTAYLAEEISIERLAELVELNSSRFGRVFKETTGMAPSGACRDPVEIDASLVNAKEPCFDQTLLLIEVSFVWPCDIVVTQSVATSLLDESQPVPVSDTN